MKLPWCQRQENILLNKGALPIDPPRSAERRRQEDTYPLLSCSDIEQLLSSFLPRRDVTKEEISFQFEKRDHYRQKAIESHARRQNKISIP